MERIKKSRHGVLAGMLALFGVVLAPLQAVGQETYGFGLNRETQLGVPLSSILTIQPERLFSDSAFGRRVALEIEAEGAVLTVENRRIEAVLRAEEQSLSERRTSMDPAAFRALADAFDEKVQETRQLQEEKLREINAVGEAARRDFFAASLPLLQQLMGESGAGAILDQSSVFLSSDAADVTDLAISRIDAVLGDGVQLDENVQQ